MAIHCRTGRRGKRDDGYIRMMAIQYKIPYITTMAAARASAEGIEEMKKEVAGPISLQEYHQQGARSAASAESELAKILSTDLSI